VRGCLRARSTLAGQIVDELLATPPADLTADMVAGISSLSVAGCEDGPAARRLVVGDPATRREVAAFHQSLVAYAAALGRGDDAEAARIERTTARAGHRQALFAAYAARDREDLAAAERAARLAVQSVPVETDPYSRALAWVLLHDALLGQAKMAEAALAEVATDQALSTVGEPAELVALFVSNRGYRAAVTGDDAGFLAGSSRALELYQALGDDAARADIEVEIAHFYMSRGKLEAAEPWLDAAEPVIRAWHGEASETYVDLLDSRRILALDRREPAQAAALGGRQLELARQGELGPEVLFTALCGQAEAMKAQGRLASAEALAREGLALDAYDPADPSRMECEMHLATMLQARGALVEAQAILLAQLPLVRANPVPMSAWVLVALGELEVERGQRAAARRAFDEALRTCRELNYLPCVRQAEIMVGRDLVLSGDLERGGTLIAGAIDYVPMDPMVRALGLMAQAVIARHAGDRAAAQALAATAVALPCHLGRVCKRLRAQAATY
jgi:tetratricopeptide (TPR) repeat protein